MAQDLSRVAGCAAARPRPAGRTHRLGPAPHRPSRQSRCRRPGRLFSFFFKLGQCAAQYRNGRLANASELLHSLYRLQCHCGLYLFFVETLSSRALSMAGLCSGPFGWAFRRRLNAQYQRPGKRCLLAAALVDRTQRHQHPAGHAPNCPEPLIVRLLYWGRHSPNQYRPGSNSAHGCARSQPAPYINRNQYRRRRGPFRHFRKTT